MGRLILIGGGARSGKSAFALRMAGSCSGRRVLLATAEAGDEEMAARIAAHQAERGDRFDTVEAPREVAEALATIDAEVVILDCLTLWISNLLLDELPPDRILERIEVLTRDHPFDLLVVSNEVGMSLVPETPLGRAFRDLVGRSHQRLAAAADEVYLAALGVVLQIKPRLELP